MSWNLNRQTQNGKFSHSSVVEMIPIENLQRPAINEKEAEIGQYLKNVENFKCCKFFSWVRQMKTCPGISRGRHSLHGAGWETSTHGGDRCGQVIIRCSLQGCNRAFTHFTQFGRKFVRLQTYRYIALNPTFDVSSKLPINIIW